MSKKVILGDNKVISYDDGAYIDISKKISYEDKIQLLKDNGINFDHYKDSMYGYYNEEIESRCHRYSKKELTGDVPRSDIISELFTELNEALYKYQPDLDVRFRYCSLWNKYQFSYPSINGPSYPRNPYKDAILKIFKNKINVTGFNGHTATIELTTDLEKILKKTIKNLNDKRPDKISVKAGEMYLLDKDCDFGTRFRLEAGSVFKVLYNGGGWDNQTKIKLVSGRVKLTVHSTFFSCEHDVKSFNGGHAFVTKDEMSEMLGLDMDLLTMEFDPYGNGAYKPCQLVRNA
jgi:hypothetical protein